jgi:2-methylcitrate dehydratase PrpD
MAITDFCGVALAGCKEKTSQIMVDYVRTMGGNPQASIIGSSLKTSPYFAALVNGTTGHSLDYDDIAVSLNGHPSVFLAPAVFAVGETLHSTGEDVLTAYVIGYETACHVARPVLQSHYTRGWHSTATFGSLGATAAVSRLLKLSTAQVKHAIGIAASLAGGLRQNFGTMTKPLHAGKAAANGVQAALLAQAGFTATENIIEAPLGFARVFGHDGDVDWAKVGAKLGKTFLITGAGGLNIKPYPSCGFTHCAIDAALQIGGEHGFNPDEIATVELGVSPFDKQILIYHRPRTGLEAKFSLEYCVARALVSGSVRMGHFDDAAVLEPAVTRLFPKMKWVEKFPLPIMGTAEGFGIKSVTLKLNSGREYCTEVAVSRGMPGNPLSTAELDAKYRDCASITLDGNGVRKSIAVLSNLDDVDDIRLLMEILKQRSAR